MSALAVTESREGCLMLVRHARTAWNDVRYLGRADVPLDERGRRQSADLAVALAGRRIDAIYSSPLTRAVDTIQPLATSRGLPITLLDELTEMSYGCWEGRSKAEHKLDVTERNLYIALPGGESLSDVLRRAEHLVGRLRPELEAGRHLVIVGHRRVNQMLLGALLQVGSLEAIVETRYRPANASVLDVRYGSTADESTGVLSMTEVTV